MISFSAAASSALASRSSAAPLALRSAATEMTLNRADSFDMSGFQVGIPGKRRFSSFVGLATKSRYIAADGSWYIGSSV